mmetsp:Transcript_54095/g.131298  ORF Transcript_54095/g.131298 Transcript_54095/m.131298 type:complete len:207 (-) Transcript_54095:79-699(-)
MKNFNNFVHGAVRKFYTAIDAYPMTVTLATVSVTTVCGIALYSTLEYLEPRNDDDRIVVDGTTQGGSGLYLGHSEKGEHYSKHAAKPAMTMERARLQAMIENAQQSSFQENIANATFAQERFMLPGRYHPDDDTDYAAGAVGAAGGGGKDSRERKSSSYPKKNNLMKKIDERSREIMEEHQQQQQKLQLDSDREKEKRRKLTTKMW